MTTSCCMQVQTSREPPGSRAETTMKDVIISTIRVRRAETRIHFKETTSSHQQHYIPALGDNDSCLICRITRAVSGLMKLLCATPFRHSFRCSTCSYSSRLKSSNRPGYSSLSRQSSSTRYPASLFVSMAPKQQSSLGYVKSSQTTLGCESILRLEHAYETYH